MLPKYLTQDELCCFFDVIGFPCDRTHFAVIYSYGLRVDGATMRTVEDLDLKNHPASPYGQPVSLTKRVFKNTPLKIASTILDFMRGFYVAWDCQKTLADLFYRMAFTP